VVVDTGVHIIKLVVMEVVVQLSLPVQVVGEAVCKTHQDHQLLVFPVVQEQLMVVMDIIKQVMLVVLEEVDQVVKVLMHLQVHPVKQQMVE
tara:strand:+ start:201 stop:473 length:273 start_codon:yes stop_codon:yes gene_type:complete